MITSVHDRPLTFKLSTFVALPGPELVILSDLPKWSGSGDKAQYRRTITSAGCPFGGANVPAHLR